jgi:alcohol oxidase
MLTFSSDPNLHVLVEKQVIKVLLENKKAVGVEYQTNPKFMANPEFLHAGYTSPRTVRARKLVVCSAGANGTPLILERSGIGNAEILKKAGVEVVEDLPGVGNDYQDHHLSLWSYRTSFKPRECINGFADGRFDIAKAIHENDELLGTNAMDGRKCIITVTKSHTDPWMQRVNSAQQKPKSTRLDPNSGKPGIKTGRMFQTGR